LAVKLSRSVNADQAFTMFWGLAGIEGYQSETALWWQRVGWKCPVNRQMLNIGKPMGIIGELPLASPTKGLDPGV